MAGPTLQVTLECELPSELGVGAGTALFVCGWCFSPQVPVRALEFVIDDEPPQPAAAARMPRLDPFRALHPQLDPFATAGLDADPASEEDPLLLSYRSGFWGIVRIHGPRPEGELELSLRARLDDGAVASARLARITVTAAARSPAPPSGSDRPPRIAICMAAHEPPEDLLRAQLDSIRAQTHHEWACVISDDCSSPEGAAVLRRAVGDDPRFSISRSPRRLGFYRNFERALTLAPAGARFIALADQDDVWHPDKLATLEQAIGSASLAFSDARVLARDGEVLSDTWWDRRRPNHADLQSLLVANAVTGAASLVRAELLADALPFPPAQFAHFHDHWLALVARARGPIAYVDRPLYDYVQHDRASLGHAAANRMPTLRERLSARRSLHDRVALWRLHYFADACRLMALAAVLELRLGARMGARQRRIVRRWSHADRSGWLLATLAARGARELVRSTPETLGAEWMLAHALAWRRLVERSARDRPQRRLRLDALPPPTLRAAPGVAGLDEDARRVADKIAPLRWSVRDDAPRRINLLIPTVDLRHFFGGYIAKLNLARRLADAGWRVRIVTVDPVGALPGDYRAQVEGYAGLRGVFDRVELVFGREAGAIEVSSEDRFVASTWWTAHIAHAAARELGGAPFLYLIQEYEPFTFAMGSYAALAHGSYALAHIALFSTELLRDYFRRHRIGVYAAGADAGDAASRAFENAISDVPAPTAAQLRRDGPRRLLFYARPEDHAARNMFELGMLALARAIDHGGFAGDWELHGIGTVRHGRLLSLGSGATLELLPRADQRAYAQLLRAHDVGLALMYTPHPSLVPLEMASAGMLTVTNSFENKTPAALAEISANLICAEPTIDAIADALVGASRDVGELERRAAGSAVRWSRDWERSFDDDLLRWVADALR